MSSNPAEGSSRRQFDALNDVKTSRSCGAGMHRSAAEGRFGEAEPAGRSSVCAGAIPIGVSSFQEKNAYFTCKNAHHPLFIGVRCTLTVKKWVNSRAFAPSRLRAWPHCVCLPSSVRLPDCSMLVNLGSDCHLTTKSITNLTCKHTRHFHSHQYIYSISLPCEYTPKPYLLLVE